MYTLLKKKASDGCHDNTRPIGGALLSTTGSGNAVREVLSSPDIILQILGLGIVSPNDIVNHVTGLVELAVGGHYSEKDLPAKGTLAYKEMINRRLSYIFRPIISNIKMGFKKYFHSTYRPRDLITPVVIDRWSNSMQDVIKKYIPSELAHIRQSVFAYAVEKAVTEEMHYYDTTDDTEYAPYLLPLYFGAVGDPSPVVIRALTKACGDQSDWLRLRNTNIDAEFNSFWETHEIRINIPRQSSSLPYHAFTSYRTREPKYYPGEHVKSEQPWVDNRRHAGLIGVWFVKTSHYKLVKTSHDKRTNEISYPEDHFERLERLDQHVPVSALRIVPVAGLIPGATGGATAACRYRFQCYDVTGGLIYDDGPQFPDPDPKIIADYELISKDTFLWIQGANWNGSGACVRESLLDDKSVYPAYDPEYDLSTSNATEDEDGTPRDRYEDCTRYSYEESMLYNITRDIEIFRMKTSAGQPVYNHPQMVVMGPDAVDLTKTKVIDFIDRVGIDIRIITDKWSGLTSEPATTYTSNAYRVSTSGRRAHYTVNEYFHIGPDVRLQPGDRFILASIAKVK